MDSKIKVLIGDDSAEYGIACASSLRAAGLYVITRRKDGRTLVDAIQHDAPDVVIVVRFYRISMRWNSCGVSVPERANNPILL